MNAKNKSKNATTLDEWHHLFFSFLCSQISIYLTSLCSLWNKKKLQKYAISKQPIPLDSGGDTSILASLHLGSACEKATSGCLP
ncbi:hypothetical protein PVAP13_2NG100603 [Panicum virgatum]|uniref:Uncharacterized protein n=1 Tax=Panicum virgatum TaxID=38727 RepID=A0A8T0VJK9_PANVG|nr:hypothetical protein PVAP13_2NG100603 [Panicum virgatum]